MMTNLPMAFDEMHNCVIIDVVNDYEKRFGQIPDVK